MKTKIIISYIGNIGTQQITIIHLFMTTLPDHSDTSHLFPIAYSGHPPGSGPCCHGHGGNLRPLCQSLFVARQKEEVRDQSSTQEFMPRFQRDFHLQGIMCPDIVLSSTCLFVLSLVFMSLCLCRSQVVDDMSLFTLMKQKFGLCLYFP